MLVNRQRMLRSLVAWLLLFVSASAVSAQTLEESSRRIADAAVNQATPGARQSDSLWNGALIGAGAGIASGLLVCSLTETWDVCRQQGGPLVAYAAIGVGIGVGIDALIHTRRVMASPMIARRAGGLQVAVKF